jgi:site-specific recombinase XerD
LRYDYLGKYTSGKVQIMTRTPLDSLQAWIDHYLNMAVRGVRSELVTRKIMLHLTRFQEFFEQRYRQELISSCVKRDVVAWQQSLIHQGLASATINHHLASLSSFATWVCNQDDQVFAMGDPTKGIGEVTLPPLEPRALNEQQVQSLKNLCDRLLPYYRLKGRQRNQMDEDTPLRLHARPWRDRAIVFVLLSTGLRREELVSLNINRVSPKTAAELRVARRAVVQLSLAHRTLALCVEKRMQDRGKPVTHRDTPRTPARPIYPGGLASAKAHLSGAGYPGCPLYGRAAIG